MQIKLAFIILAVTTASNLVAAVPDVAARNARIDAIARKVERSKDSADVDSYLYVCTDDYFGGECANIGFNWGVCNNFPSGFQDDISSWGPDSGWVCTTYTDFNCNGCGATYTGGYPGFSTLPSGINDALNSFSCWD